MIKSLIGTLALVTTLVSQPTIADPQQDQNSFRNYFLTRFPGVIFDDYKNGVYALDAVMREEWQAADTFPPYRTGLQIGQREFEQPFRNGKSYAGCFKNRGMGIRQHYPYFDPRNGELKTLEGEINECRYKNDEPPLEWGSGKLAAVAAYMASTAQGQKLNVRIPRDARAMDYYDRGKKHFYAKRGQLNMSCADCHMYNSGNKYQADTLHAALGNLSHFPAYKRSWEGVTSNALAGFGTSHRQFKECNERVRAQSFPLQSDEYKALEYFLSYMSNGIEINAPGLR